MGQEEGALMRVTLRALERKLVQERAEIGVPEVIDRFLFRSNNALGQGVSPPDPLVLFKALNTAGFYLPTPYSALHYLEQCQRDATPPDAHRLFRLLLPSKL